MSRRRQSKPAPTPAIPSSSISTNKSLDDCPIVQHRILSLDVGQYRRQIEHFEYYWGLQKGELNLESPLNHIELRLDMSEKLTVGDWALVPTQETLRSMLQFAKYNSKVVVRARKHYLTEFPPKEYEYNVVPLYMLKKNPPPLYVHGDPRIKMLRAPVKTFRAPYKNLPHIKSSAHPFFAVWVACDQLDLEAPLVMSIEESESLRKPVGDIVDRWYDAPPEEFLIGPDVWKQHRHPLSDDGQDAAVALQNSREVTDPACKRRKTTRAPCRQAKITTRAKPYARYDTRSAADRGSALPRPGIQSQERTKGYIAYDLSDLRTWIDRARAESTSVSSSETSASLTWSELWLDDESASDAILAQYRRESARDAEDALHPQSTINGGGLIYGEGEDRSRFSSNNWAMRATGACLWTLGNPRDGIKCLQ
ncbi:hypothetical protein K523DRAFT_336262 [Schizophyllum commune Tattone D]|nr:hypothetical protein K523DRAFT_336262 [Schizophyllum commune Tattone D]